MVVYLARRWELLRWQPKIVVAVSTKDGIAALVVVAWRLLLVIENCTGRGGNRSGGGFFLTVIN